MPTSRVALQLIAVLLFLLQVPHSHARLLAGGLLTAGSASAHAGIHAATCHDGQAARVDHAGGHVQEPRQRGHDLHDCTCCAPSAIGLPGGTHLIVPGLGLAHSPPALCPHGRRLALATRARGPPSLLTA